MVNLEKGPGSTAPSLVDRVKAIILKPNEEWPKIKAESDTQADILKSYVLPLAAIGPVASFIGGQVFGLGGPFISIKPSLMGGLTTAILTFVLSIVGVFVLAFIADALAPKFEGKSDKLAAFKLVAYSWTAAWLAGIFGLIPALGVFGLLGLYSIYLLYTGSDVMMAIPETKRVAYTAVTIVIALVVNLVVGLIAGSIVALFGLGAAATSAISDASDDDVTISIPGVGSVNTGKMEEAAERMERVQRGEIKPVPADTLKAMLPDAIGPFQRTGFSSTSIGNLGSGVEGEYKLEVEGDQNYQFDLSVRDMLAAGGGLMAITGMIEMEQEREDENGYERIGKVNGQWRSEKWNTQSNRGSYSIFVGDRFQVEASGTAPTIDVLKGAVDAIDRGDLEDLAEE
jgi:hypothetical protein